ncbi:MAG: tetratricopeptide repeat protein [Sedimentisphaerales bacterium]|nr:tetratricopeptide repeat protein [Sedimentisphaerales bacterium]
MSRLLEILGRGMTVDTADLIWHWLRITEPSKEGGESLQTQQLNKVIELMTARKTEAAREQLRIYLFEYPDCVRGRMASAAVCLNENQLDAAIKELNSVYMRQPNNTMALYALGHSYERLGKEAEAVEFYQDCLKFKNYLQLPRQRLAAVYFKNGQLEKTVAEYELLRSEYPDDLPTLLALGHLHIAGAKYIKAIETFNTAILIHPDNFRAEDDIIDQLIAEGRLQEAAQKLEELLAEHSDKADLIVKYADVLSMLGAKTEAISHYEEAIRICPGFLDATIKLGTHYLQIGDERLAAQQFNRAVEINDQIVDSYIGLAIAQKLAGNVSAALVTLSLASAIDANSSLLLAETATLQLKTDFLVDTAPDNANDSIGLLENDSINLIEDVIKIHQRQIVRRPQNLDLNYRLAVLMMSVGKLNDAVKLLQTSLEINPTYARARSKLTVCLFETNQKQAALEQLIGPDCINKDTLELHYKVALLYCDKLKFASSLINLNRLLENNFTSADATVNISVVLQNLGLLDRATAMWDNLSDTAAQARNS